MGLLPRIQKGPVHASSVFSVDFLKNQEVSLPGISILTLVRPSTEVAGRMRTSPPLSTEVGEEEEEVSMRT